MKSDYLFLMSVYNEIVAENVMGILEMEGIEAEKRYSQGGDVKNVFAGYPQGIDIYVPGYSYEEAREIIETEMVRGDL